jgi:hypothetical protein
MADPTDPTVWWALVERGGLLFVFASLAVGQAWAYFKRWVIPGWLLTERDQRIATLEGEVLQWQTLALQSIGLSTRFASVALPATAPLTTRQSGV